jgi:hypothetical protein
MGSGRGAFTDRFVRSRRSVLKVRCLLQLPVEISFADPEHFGDAATVSAEFLEKPRDVAMLQLGEIRLVLG